MESLAGRPWHLNRRRLRMAFGAFKSFVISSLEEEQDTEGQRGRGAFWFFVPTCGSLHGLRVPF